MKKPIIILLAFYTIGLLFEACCPNDGLDYCSSVDSTSVKVYDMSAEEPVSVSTQPVRAEDMMIRLKVAFVNNICKREAPFRVFNTAYATSCRVDNTYFTNDTVKNIIITADKPYSDLHPVGSGLNEFFKMPSFEETRVDDPDYGVPRVDYDLRALAPPAQAGVYSFKILLVMTSGKNYEATTQPINITL